MIQSDITRKYNAFVAEQDIIVGKDSFGSSLSLELGSGSGGGRFEVSGGGGGIDYKGGGGGTRHYTLGGGGSTGG